MRRMPVFDCGALFDALDTQRRDLGLGWYELADELWEQSSDLNRSAVVIIRSAVERSRGCKSVARRPASTRCSCCAGSTEPRRTS